MKKGKKKRDNFLKLNPVKFGLAWAIVIAFIVAFTTIFGLYGYFPVNNMLILDLYGRFGHGLSAPSFLLGIIYSFIDAFILTWLFALISNKLK